MKKRRKSRMLKISPFAIAVAFAELITLASFIGGCLLLMFLFGKDFIEDRTVNVRTIGYETSVSLVVESTSAKLVESNGKEMTRVVARLRTLLPDSFHRPTIDIMESLASEKMGSLQRDTIRMSPHWHTVAWLADEKLNDGIFETNKNSNEGYSKDRVFIERYVLSILYFFSLGKGWGNRKMWLEDNNPCNWYGIACGLNGNGGPVRVVDLTGNGLSRPSPFSKDKDERNYPYGVYDALPREITLLNSLELLWIGDNPKLGGTIPSWISEISSIRSMGLWNCSLTGTMPQGLGSIQNLTSLRIHENKISGKIDAKMIRNWKEAGMSWLWLHNNKLQSVLPARVFEGWYQLQGLALNGNDELDTFSEEFLNIVCALRRNGTLEHLWLDCEKNIDLSMQCKCCTRCFHNQY